MVRTPDHSIAKTQRSEKVPNHTPSVLLAGMARSLHLEASPDFAKTREDAALLLAAAADVMQAQDVDATDIVIWIREFKRS